MKIVLIPILVAGLLFASCLMYVISLRVRSVLAVTMPDSVRPGDDFVARLTLRNVERSEMTLDHFSLDSKYEANFADGITPGKSAMRHTRPVPIRVRVDGECRC